MANNGVLIRAEDGSAAYYRNSCKFNEGVDCFPLGRKCERCGWNPVVAQARLKKICKEKGLTMPDKEG